MALSRYLAESVQAIVSIKNQGGQSETDIPLTLFINGAQIGDPVKMPNIMKIPLDYKATIWA